MQHQYYTFSAEFGTLWTYGVELEGVLLGTLCTESALRRDLTPVEERECSVARALHRSSQLETCGEIRNPTTLP